MSQTGKNGAEHYAVIVVGAGFAGLYMLHRLREAGHRVTCFEDGSGPGGGPDNGGPGSGSGGGGPGSSGPGGGLSSGSRSEERRVGKEC